MGFTGGSSTPTLTIHPEIYYSYDRTNWFGDFSGGTQAIVHGTTNIYEWAINFPTLTATNSTGFYVQRRFKCDSVTGAGVRTFTILIGTNVLSGVNDATHVTMQSPSATSGDAFLAANQTFTGSNQFAGGMMVWGDANKTNGVLISPAGEVLSNAVGSVTIAGGNVTASGTFSGNAASLTNLYGTNITGRAVYMTNAYDGILLDSTRQYQTFVTNQGFTISGIAGLVSGSQHIFSICYSNSSSTNIIVTGPASVHYPTMLVLWLRAVIANDINKSVISGIRARLMDTLHGMCIRQVVPRVGRPQPGSPQVLIGGL